MAIELHCPHCQHRSVAPEHFLGHSLLCKRCGKTFPAIRADATLESKLNPAGAATVPGQPAEQLAGSPRGPGTPTSDPGHPKEIGGFAVHRLLGEGVFGRVYLGYDARLDRWVALKVPHAGALGSPHARQRFEREARAAARLRHPHIVPVYAAGHDG
jgi:hypothetical protein